MNGFGIDSTYRQKRLDAKKAVYLRAGGSGVDMDLLRNDIVWITAQPDPAQKMTLSTGRCWTLDATLLIPSHMDHCDLEKI
jgi:hypothetical protein